MSDAMASPAATAPQGEEVAEEGFVACLDCKSQLQEEEGILLNKKRVEELGNEPLVRCKPCHRLQKRITEMRKHPDAPPQFETWTGKLTKDERVQFMKTARDLFGNDLNKAGAAFHMQKQSIIQRFPFGCDTRAKTRQTICGIRCHIRFERL